MNVALEVLLINRATRDFHHKELDLNVELVVCLNDAQAAEAIKQAVVHHATTDYVFQQAHRDRVLVLEHDAKAEEGWDHQAFMEAFGVAISACPPKMWGHSYTPYSSWLVMCH